MHDKKAARLRRALSARKTMRRVNAKRLCVFRSSKHIYVQIISAEGDKVLVSASSLDADIKQLGYTGNILTSEKVGEKVAKLALEAGIEQVAFDRSGFMYHGRIKSLAESARKAGLQM